MNNNNSTCKTKLELIIVAEYKVVRVLAANVTQCVTHVVYVLVMYTFVYFSEEKIDSLLKETLRPASTLLTHVQICIVFWILGKSKNTTCHFATGFVSDIV